MYYTDHRIFRMAAAQALRDMRYHYQHGIISEALISYGMARAYAIASRTTLHTATYNWAVPRLGLGYRS